LAEEEETFMKRGVLVLVLVVVIAALLMSQGALAEERMEYVPGEIIIGFNPGSTEAQISAAVGSLGGVVIGSIDLPQAKIRKIRISATGRPDMDAVITEIRNSPLILETIKYVEPNLIGVLHQGRGPAEGDGGEIQSQSSDPYLSQQWGYYDLGADVINAQTAPAPVVAVIDTGVDYTHPDLAGKIIKGKDYVNDDNDPMDDQGHGTHVAGVIAAKTNNFLGIAGISWSSKVLAVKVCNSAGGCPLFETTLGIRYAANNPDVKILNMSLGFPPSATLQDAVEYAVVSKKKLLIASAGNSNSSTPSYPAGLSTTYPGRVLAVAAHGTDHCRASFSNYGTWISTTAPGIGIISTVPSIIYGADYVGFSGTSMAAPHVSGAAAVAWGKFPTYNNAEIGNLIMNNSSSTQDPLNRNGTCWPNDGSTFHRVSLIHAIEPDPYEACQFWDLYGFALDAESGGPLTGAKVTTKTAGKVVGVDYVPNFGTWTNPLNNSTMLEGYGLFRVMNHKSSPDQSVDLTVQKPNYAKLTIPDLPVRQACGADYVGNLPVPAIKPFYWLAVTWGYGNLTRYDAVLNVPGYGDYYYMNPGSLQEAPWVKLFWDWAGFSDLRRYSGVFRIKRLVPGTYSYRILDETGAGSTSWSTSGIKAYIYRWDATLGQPKLISTFTPPAGGGQWWEVCTITGQTVTPVNALHD
jgi:thermitase